MSIRDTQLVIAINLILLAIMIDYWQDSSTKPAVEQQHAIQHNPLGYRPSDTTEIQNVVTPREPRVCLNMIVKDEPNVTYTLDSVMSVITSAVIIDTGSTDDTVKRMDDFLKQYKIRYTIIKRPWKDFGSNREEALRLAIDFESRVPKEASAELYLFMDADDALHIEPHAGDHLWGARWEDYDAFEFTIHYAPQVYSRRLAVTARADCHWYEPVHEYLSCHNERRVFHVKHMWVQANAHSSRRHSQVKYRQDADILYAAFQRDPTNTRTAFYLAQSYRDAGMYPEAIAMYEKRASMDGWIEEVFYSWFQAGTLRIYLNHSEYLVHTALHYAYFALPTRAESLHALAVYYRHRKQYSKCYAAAVVGANIPHPGSRALFVHTPVYDYEMLDELSVCAYYMGHFKESREAAEKLLDPARNLPSYYVERVQENVLLAQRMVREHNR